MGVIVLVVKKRVFFTLFILFNLLKIYPVFSMQKSLDLEALKRNLYNNQECGYRYNSVWQNLGNSSPDIFKVSFIQEDVAKQIERKKMHEFAHAFIGFKNHIKINSISINENTFSGSTGYCQDDLEALITNPNNFIKWVRFYLAGYAIEEMLFGQGHYGVIYDLNQAVKFTFLYLVSQNRNLSLLDLQELLSENNKNLLEQNREIIREILLRELIFIKNVLMGELSKPNNIFTKLLDKYLQEKETCSQFMASFIVLIEKDMKKILES